MSAGNPTNHDALIRGITEKEFGKPPVSVSRMGNGICNEVYLVDTGETEVVFRMHEHPRYLLGSHNHIPIFQAKGIRVPEILAEDYSKSDFPIAYQIVSKIEGRDIKDLIHTLTDDQLQNIAGEIANVFRQLADVPNNGKYGVLWGDGDDLVDSWTADIERMTGVVKGWGTRTGVLDEKLGEILDWILAQYHRYFDNVKPTTYFGDICAKNVMIHEGRFSGLVDLDSLAQGDPLEAVGRIKASWYGTHYGQIYTEAVMDALELTAEQRKIVTMYALLNRTYWTMENGIQFNQNTTPVVDRAIEKEDKRIVGLIFAELLVSVARP